MYDVACIGILVADVIAKTVDKIPERGKLGLIDGIKMYSGGCAMNAAIDLAKLGSKTAIVGKIGEDGFGWFLQDELQQYGVNVSGLKTDSATDTSSSVVLVDGEGERTFLHCLGANGVFNDADVDFSVLNHAKIVFVAGTMLMPSFDGEPCSRVLKKAKEMSKITVLDTAWDDKGRWMQVLAPCMPFIDYFIPSIEEAVQISGQNEPYKIAQKFFEAGVKHVAIKLGKDGCFVRENEADEGYIIPTYNRIKAVDTTGAGDSFCAGFLYGLSHGMNMRESARLANAVGTHCVMTVGATSGMKSYEEIKAFMEREETKNNK